MTASLPLSRLLLVGSLVGGACQDVTARAPEPTPAPRTEAVSLSSRVYVSNEDSGDISVLDPEKDELVSTIRVGKRPRGLRLSPDGRFLYVAVSGSAKAPPGVDEATLPAPDRRADGIAVVDLSAQRVVRTLESGTDPESFDLSPDGRWLYVSNEDAGRASVLDVRSGKVVRSFEVGGEPEGVTTRPDGAVMYVTSEEDGTIAVIDTHAQRVVSQVAAGPRPRSVTFSADGSRAFVSLENGAAVGVLDAQRHVPLVQVKIPGELARPMGLALSPDGQTLYVSTGRGKSVAFVDVASAQVTRLVDEVGARPWGVGLSPDGRKLYTANGSSDDVSIIDVGSGRVHKRIKVGRSPWGVAVAR